MRRCLIIFSLIVNICTSCRQIYNPDIEADTNIIIVEGLITDEVKRYSVRLTKALASDGSQGYAYTSVDHARIAIYDEKGNTYDLKGSGNGKYWTDSTLFVGLPGKSYTLHIETPDGNIFESSPQLMLPNDFHDSVYAEFITKEILIQNSGGQYVIQSTPGVNLVKDIDSNTDSLPRFRFQSNATTEIRYYYGGEQYLWFTTNPDNIVNLIDEKYGNASHSIKNHVLCFIPTIYVYPVAVGPKKDKIIYVHVLNRIIQVTQYRLNQETYRYYKGLNTLLSAEGKIYDPIAFSLQGNITCLTEPQKKVLGFFEVSSVRTKTYSNRPGSKNIKNESNVAVLPDDCVGEAPDFWIE